MSAELRLQGRDILQADPMKQDGHRTTGPCSALPVGKPVHISLAGDEVLVIVE